MAKVMYGVKMGRNCHTDVAFTEHGAKCFATRKGFNVITIRDVNSDVAFAYKMKTKHSGWVLL